MKLLQELIVLLEEEYPIKYKGFEIHLGQDSDDFWWVTYKPDLPKDIDQKYTSGATEEKAIANGKKAIDEFLARRGSQPKGS